MLILIFFVIGGAYFGGSMFAELAYGSVWDKFDYFGVGLGIFAGGGLGLLAGMAFAALFGAFLPQNWKQYAVYPLHAMNNGSGITGQFYLARGSISGGWAYNYYIRSDEGLLPQQLLVKGAYVVVSEIEQGEPRLEVSIFSFMYSWMKWFGLSSKGRRHHFFVPKGSVKEGFDI